MTVALFKNLDQGAALIASSACQAQQYRLAFAQWKRSEGVEAWSSPKIYSWAEWLKKTGENLLWSGYSGAEGVRSLLSPLQEQIVWEQVIRSAADTPLLHLPSTAALARQAWSLLQAWRLPNPSDELYHSEDVIAYAKWMDEYFKQCRDKAWLDHARLPDTLKRAINKGLVELPHNIILSGFLQLTPQQHEIVKAIQGQGVKVNLFKAQQFTFKPQAFSFSNARDELVAIANWCKQTLEAFPQDRIAVVLPELGRQREQFDYILRKALFPTSFSSGQEFVNNVYQFTSGYSLVDSQVAKTATILLDLMEGTFTLDQVSYLLRSPYLYAGKEEHLSRVHLDRWLRKKNYLRFDLTTLIDAIATYHRAPDGRSEASLFEISLQTLRSTMGMNAQHFAPSDWAKHFQMYIEKFGWPGSQLSVTEQYQAKNLRSALTEFASIDYVLDEMSFSAALATVKRIYRSKALSVAQVFAPIQVLDLTDVYGLNYDHLWVGQLNDKVLPEATMANPMLPYQWQQQRKIMNATPESRLAEAQKRIRHLVTCAPNTVVSYAQDGKDEAEQAPTMLRQLDYVSQQSIYFENIKKAETEWVEENYGPAYQGSKEVNTNLFKYQSACPFRGFAEKRLFPEKIQTGEHGLSAMQRGILLHQVLEFVWSQIGALDTLHIALQSDHLEMQVWGNVDKVVDLYEVNNRTKIPTRLKALEVQRLVRLTMAWLKLESKRSSFKINATEKVQQVRIGELTVNCRIDRIDEVHNLGFAVIDYKSGSHSQSEWFGETPIEPQMPIYALTEDLNIVALMYANLKPKEMGFKGVVESDDVFPGIKSFDSLPANRRHELTWNELKPYWRKHLENIGTEFLQGYAVPFQKDGSECKNCDLHSLCRARALATGRLTCLMILMLLEH